MPGTRPRGDGMIRIDANVILRYLLGDHPDHSKRAAEVIDDSAVFAAYEVICEVVYVLSGVYSVDRNTIAEKMIEFINLDTVVVDDAQILTVALQTYTGRRIDFVDALLYAYKKIHGDHIVTFDQKLVSLLNSN